MEKLVDRGSYRPLLWRYRWDARSQLTGLETPEDERWEYKYDPFGRRISKRCTNRDKPGTDFHCHVDQLTEEIPASADGTPDHDNVIRWIYEPGSFTPLARYEKGELHYAVTDITGRIQELAMEDGTLVWRGQQQLWGREESRNKEDAPSCRLRFPGQYEDAESGLYYNRFRYYDCGTGQYICADPIGLRGGLNLYAYAPNPLSYIDPLGLKCGGVNRRQALNKAKDLAGIPRSQQPNRQWTVGNNPTIRGQTNYKYSEDLGSHGRYYEYTDARGHKRVVVEHTADPRALGPHTLAGQPKPGADPRTYDFKNDRYQKINNPSTNDHHIYYA